LPDEQNWTALFSSIACCQTCYTYSADGNLHGAIYTNQQSHTEEYQSVTTQNTLINECEQWTHFHVASFATVCSNAIPKPYLTTQFSILLFRLDPNTFQVHNRQHRV